MSGNPAVIQRTQVGVPNLLLFQCLASLLKFYVSLRKKTTRIPLTMLINGGVNDGRERRKWMQSLAPKHWPCDWRVTLFLRNKFSWLPCIFYVFFSVLQSKTQFPGWRWHWFSFLSKSNWDNRGNFDLIGTFPPQWHLFIGGNYFCQCTHKSIFQHWFNNEK